MGVSAGYWHVWLAGRHIWRLLVAVRANLLVCGMVGAALLLSDQSTDAINALGEDWYRTVIDVAVLACIAVLSAMLWFTFRSLRKRMRPDANMASRLGLPFLTACLQLGLLLLLASQLYALAIGEAPRESGQDTGNSPIGRLTLLRPASMLVCTTAFGVALWFTSRNLLRRVRPDVRPARINRLIHSGLPYLIAGLPWSLLLLAWFSAEAKLSPMPVPQQPVAAARKPSEIPPRMIPGYRVVIYDDGHVEAFPQADAAGLKTQLMWTATGTLACALLVVALHLGLAKWVRRPKPVPDGEFGRRPHWMASRLSRVVAWWTDDDDVQSVERYVWTALVMLCVILLIAASGPPAAAQAMGPIGVLMAAAMFWCFILNPLLLLCRRGRVPLVSVMLVLALLAGGADCNDNHAIRRLDSSKSLPTTAPATPSVVEEMEQWLAERCDYRCGTPYPVFLVAAEGGGIRNAYWTASVLADLHDRYPAFRHHLFAVSGVSGGAVGAAVHAALVGEQETKPSLGPLLPRARHVLSADLLSPVLARGATADLLQQFIPYPIEGFDRARALEEALERAWEQAVPASPQMSSGFRQLRNAAPPGSNVPALLLGTTDVDTGHVVPISHVAVSGSLRVTGFLDLLPDDDLPLSTAACLAARFPVVTPPGTLNLSVGVKKRFVDGGYFENTGVSALMQMIQVLAAESESPSRKTVVQRCTGRLCQVSLADVRLHIILIEYRGPQPTPKTRAFGDLLSPALALLAAREARGAVTVSEMEWYLTHAARNAAAGAPTAPQVVTVQHLTNAQAPTMAQIHPLVIRYQVTQQDLPLPLGWTLSATARGTIDAQLALVDHQRVSQVLRNFHGPPARRPYWPLWQPASQPKR